MTCPSPACAVVGSVSVRMSAASTETEAVRPLRSALAAPLSCVTGSDTVTDAPEESPSSVTVAACPSVSSVQPDTDSAAPSLSRVRQVQPGRSMRAEKDSKPKGCCVTVWPSAV